MEISFSAAFNTAEAHRMAEGRRRFYPSACALNPSCTVAVLSTVAGARAYKLMTACEQRGGAVVQPLHPRPPSTAAVSSEPTSDSAGSADGTAPPTALWRTPVYTATMAGDSALVAVVFRARPPVFVPSTVAVTRVDEGQSHDAEAAPPASSSSNSGSGVGADAAASSPGDEELPESPMPAEDPANVSALVAAEAECRRYVYLFDATSGTCLAALHFCGSPVLALRANSSVLLVAAVDLFHLVDLRTLRYIRQQSMYKPLNPRGVLDLSAAVPSRKAGGGTSYAVAFPQSARGYGGDVTVLTLHCVPSTSRRQAQTGDGGRQASGVSAAVGPGRTSLSTTAAAANATTSGAFGAATPPMEQRTIPAHHHAVTHLRFRPDGRLLATASELGTTVKLFDSLTGALLVELQRGHRPAAVLSLAVQQDAHRIAALSANGTLHVFDCAAIVQSWESAREARVSSSLPAHGARSPTVIGGAAGASKVRAECKHKVNLMPHPAASASAASAKSTPRRLGSAVMAAAAGSSRANYSSSYAESSSAPPGAGAAANDGWLHCESGFAADGRTVWVAQVQSTEVQLQHAASTAPSKSATPSPRLCVGSLTCFPLPSPNRGRSGGTVSPADKGEEGCHYVVV
ncbi:WD domain, G-beta repeat family protein [Leishmania donovani]|nr:WD domain, G-beta repeat family protein [Leishmania donovani]